MYEAYMDSYSSITSRQELFKTLFDRYGTDLLMYGFRLFEDEPIPASTSTFYELESIFANNTSKALELHDTIFA